MEVSVLRTRMADSRAELEVQKLQELVRKLELQNEQLRTRANAVSPSPLSLRQTSCCIQSISDQCSPRSDPHTFSAADKEDGDFDGQLEENAPAVALLDKLDLLDLEKLSPDGESEETWLYMSLRSRVHQAAGWSVPQWCRQVLDQHRPELTRRTLFQKLESVSRWRSGCSSVPVGGVVAVSPLCTSSPCTTPTSRTSCQRADDGNVSWGSAGRIISRSTSESVSLSSNHKLQDVRDVQVMARLQEESLRKDFASSLSFKNSRRNSSFTFQFGHPVDDDDDDDDDDDEEEYGQLPPPQPRLCRPGALHMPHSHTFSSIRDWINTSQPYANHMDTGSPASSPKLSPAPRDSGNNVSSDHLKSLPNLLLSPSLIPLSTTASTSSTMRHSQSFDSCGALNQQQCRIPSPVLKNRTRSIGNFSCRKPPKATAYVSPTVKSPSGFPSPSSSGIPLPSKVSSIQTPVRSGLPRLASASRSKLATPVRSLLKTQKSLATFSTQQDDSWENGF